MLELILYYAHYSYKIMFLRRMLKMYVIRRKKDNLFYNNLNWVSLDRARIFKKIRDLTLFLNYNLIRKGGFASFENGSTSKDMVKTKLSDVDLIELEFKVKKIVEDVKWKK